MGAPARVSPLATRALSGVRPGGTGGMGASDTQKSAYWTWYTVGWTCGACLVDAAWLTRRTLFASISREFVTGAGRRSGRARGYGWGWDAVMLLPTYT
jgi:hypothetical protein